MLFLVGGLPRFGYSSYGYASSGIVGMLTIVALRLPTPLCTDVKI